MNGEIYHSLVATYEDDELNPLMVVTPLLDDEMVQSIFHLLSAESFDIHFFDDNNRELLGYRSQNTKFAEFHKNQYKLAPSNLEAAYEIRDLTHHRFMRRSLQDDKNSIKVNFLEPLMVEDMFILDAIPMNNLFQKRATCKSLDP